MELIVKIPDEVYKTVLDGSYCGSLYEELLAAIPFVADEEKQITNGDAWKSYCEGQEVGFKKAEDVFERMKLIQETVNCIRNTFKLDTESDKLVRNCMALVQNAIDGEYHDMEEVDVSEIERTQGILTEAEKRICKMYLEDLDKTHTCNEYKLLMSLIDNAQSVKPEYVYLAKIAFDENKLKELTDDIVERIKNGEIVVKDERPKGEWIDRMADKGYVECPFCHKQITGGDLNFCVKCGADMRGEENE